MHTLSKLTLAAYAKVLPLSPCLVPRGGSRTEREWASMVARSIVRRATPLRLSREAVEHLSGALM